MKKKLLITLLLISSVFVLTGCKRNIFKKQVTLEEAIEKGQIYESVSLYDNNVEVFKSIVPKGWKATIESNWNNVSSVTPGIETVTISSPDHSANIKIISQECYTENKKYNEGVNKDYYTTYLHYMNASDYINYYMNKYNNGSKFLQDVEMDENIVKQVKEYNNIIYQAGLKDAETINATGQVKVGVSLVDSTASTKQFEYGLNQIEMSTAVAATKTTLESSLSSLLNSESILWKIPYTIIYTGETKEDFDKYYDTYKFIVANSNFTLDYYAMEEYVSNAIVNYVTAIYTEKSKAGLDAWHNYVDSNYSSASSQSTNDKVMEMWDDVIKEVDSYKLEDGTQLKTSIYNETVAQNGNDIYIGDKAGIPIGFQTVDKGY